MSWLDRKGASGLLASMVLHAGFLGAVVSLTVMTPSALPETATQAGVDVSLSVPRSAPAPPGGPPRHRPARVPHAAAPSQAEMLPGAPSPVLTDVSGAPDDTEAPGCLGCSVGGDPAGDPRGGSDATDPTGAAGSPIRPGGDLKPPVKVRHVAPVFPEIAKAARVQGVVILDCIIGLDGRVTAVHVLQGHPLLEPAAVDAVRQWLYRPSLLNGQPVAVIMTVTVRFMIPR